MKDQSFDFLIFEFFFFFMFELFEHSKYMIIYKIGNLWNFDRFPNCKILKICYFSKLYNLRNWIILEIVQFGKLQEIFEFGNFRNF